MQSIRGFIVIVSMGMSVAVQSHTIGTIGTLKNGKFARRADFPEVPTLEDLLLDKKPTGIPWQAYVAFIGPKLIDKPLAAPPGTPDNVMAMLTDALSKTAKDPQFDDMVKKMVSDMYDVGIGNETDSLMKQVIDAPPEALEYAKNLQIKFGIISR